MPTAIASRSPRRSTARPTGATRSTPAAACCRSRRNAYPASTDTGRRVCPPTACPPTPTAWPSTRPSGTATTASARTRRSSSTCPTSTPSLEPAAVDRHRRIARRRLHRWCSSTPPPASAIPLWAELDAQADDDADRLLTIRPAISLAEGHTFAVGLRGLVDSRRRPDRTERRVPSSTATASPPTIERIEARRDAMERRARRARRRRRRPRRPRARLGLHRRQHRATSASGCCTSATTRSPQLGDAAPAFTITAVTPSTDGRHRPPGRGHLHRAQLPHRRRRARATGSTTATTSHRPPTSCPCRTAPSRRRSSATSASPR